MRLRLEPVAGERRKDLGRVPGAAGLDRHVDGDPFGRHVEEEPAVGHLEDVGAELAEPARHPAEHAGPVVRGDAEGGDAVLPLELAHHHGGKKPRIDVAAAQDEPDPPPPEQIGLAPASPQAPPRRRLPPCVCWRVAIGVDRALDQRLLDEDDLGDEVAHDRQGERARRS